MQIQIAEQPNCTWALDGTRFYCTHDEEGVHEMLEKNYRPDERFSNDQLKHVVLCADEACREDITPSYSGDEF